MRGTMKYISYGKEIIKGRLANKNIPVFVTLCVTNRCNLRCKYCYEDYYDRNHREFTTEEITSLIDEFYSMGTRYISINGGEALLRKDIEVIIDKVVEKNILCHLSTNGLLVPKKIHTLKKLDSIAISIDGSRECNDINRGEGSYDKIIKAFECLKENNIKFHTHTVLTKNNKNAVDEITELAPRYGFMSQFSILRSEDSPDKQINLSDNEIRETVKKIIEYKEKGYPIFFSLSSYRNVMNWPFSYDKQMISDESESVKKMDCYLKRFSCHIEANGLVYPCVVLVNKFNALNFLETGFRKAWENLAGCKCRACYNICLNDLNQIYMLKPAVMLNAFKIVKKRILGR